MKCIFKKSSRFDPMHRVLKRFKRDHQVLDSKQNGKYGFMGKIGFIRVGLSSARGYQCQIKVFMPRFLRINSYVVSPITKGPASVGVKSLTFFSSGPSNSSLKPPWCG